MFDPTRKPFYVVSIIGSIAIAIAIFLINSLPLEEKQEEKESGPTVRVQSDR